MVISTIHALWNNIPTNMKVIHESKNKSNFESLYRFKTNWYTGYIQPQNIGNMGGTFVSGVSVLPFYMTWYLTIVGVFLIFVFGFQPPPQSISWPLSYSWCLIFGISNNKTCIQWCRGRDHTCSRVTSFRYESKNQTATQTETNKGQTTKSINQLEGPTLPRLRHLWQSTLRDITG